MWPAIVWDWWEGDGGLQLSTASLVVEGGIVCEQQSNCNKKLEMSGGKRKEQQNKVNPDFQTDMAIENSLQKNTQKQPSALKFH